MDNLVMQVVVAVAVVVVCAYLFLNSKPAVALDPKKKIQVCAS
jgi:hypothetical protein